MDSLRRDGLTVFLLDRVKLAVASASKVTSKPRFAAIRVVVDIQ